MDVIYTIVKVLPHGTYILMPSSLNAASQYDERQSSKWLHYEINRGSEMKGVQEKESIMVSGINRKLRPSGPLSGITRQMPDSDPRDGCFYLPLTIIIDPYTMYNTHYF